LLEGIKVKHQITIYLNLALKYYQGKSFNNSTKTKNSSIKSTIENLDACKIIKLQYIKTLSNSVIYLF